MSESFQDQTILAYYYHQDVITFLVLNLIVKGVQSNTVCTDEYKLWLNDKKT